MPTYNDRRYRAEEARREAEGIHQRYGLNANTMRHIHALTDYANNLDEMNAREVDYGPRNESPEMRRRYRTRSEMDMGYDEAEMRGRRRDRYGRFMEGEDNTHMMVSAPYHSNAMPSYYPHRPQMHQGGGSEYSNTRIGFAGGQKMHSKENMFEGLEKYFDELMTHKRAAKQTNDPTEEEHAMLEGLEFLTLYEKLFRKASDVMTSPEEKQKIAQMLQRMQKMMQP